MGATVTSPQLAQWAAAHARTVGRRAAGGDLPPPVLPDRPEFRPTRVFDGHSERVWAVSVRTMPDGRRMLATGSADRTARLWDLDTGRSTSRLPVHGDTVREVEWAPDDDARPALATIDAREVVIWDDTGRRLQTLAGHGAEVNDVVWVRQEGALFLATSGTDRTARIWSADDGSELGTLDLEESPGGIDWVGGPDGPCLAVGDLRGGVRIWDPTLTSDPRRVDGHADGVFALAAEKAPYGRQRFATGAKDGSVRIWDAGTGRCVRELDGHPETVWGIAWTGASAGRTLVATASGDRTARIWDPDTGECVAVLHHPDEVNAVEFVDGGLQLVTGCDDTRARLWSAELPAAGRPGPRTSGSAALTFRRTHAFADHEQSVLRTALTEAPDGRLLLATASGHTVRIWDADTGALQRTLPDHAEDVADIVWAPDRQGRLELTSVDTNGQLSVWDPATGQRIAGHSIGPTWSIARTRHPDGRELLAGSGSGTAVQVWEHDTGQPVRAFRDPAAAADDYAAAMAFTVDGGRLLLASGHTGGSARVWDVDSGRLLAAPMGHSGFVASVAWARSADDGSLLLVTASNDGSVRVWDGRTGALRRTLSDDGEQVYWLSCARLPDGRALVATGGDSRTAHVWDVDSGASAASIGHPDDALGVSLWADGTGRLVLATACADGNAYTWEAHTDPTAGSVSPPARTAEPPGGLSVGGHAPLSGLGFVLDSELRSSGDDIVRAAALTVAPDGRVLLASSRGTRAFVWDVGTKECLRTIEGLDDEILQSAWSRDGSLLVTADRSGAARIWDGLTGASMGLLDGHAAAVWDAAWTVHPDGRVLLATASDDDTARVWDVGTGRCLQTVTCGTDVNAVAWGTDRAGRPILVIGAMRGSVRILDLGTGAERVAVEHGGDIWSVAWGRRRSGDGFLVSTAFWGDGEVRIWDAESGTCLHTLETHEGDVYDASTVRLPDGRWLVGTAGADNTVRVWDPESGECLQTLTHAREVNRLSLLVVGDRLLLATGCDDGVARVWAADLAPLRLRPPGSPAEQAVVPDRRPVAVAEAVLLGSRGVWQPLGLTSDLVALTGPTGAANLFDPRLRMLADHPGVERLRALAWPSGARAAFAALLGADRPVPERFRPPPGPVAADQRAALAGAVAVPHGPAEMVGDTDSLVRAADRVTAATVTLLKVIGPRAAAADPLLAVRLAHRAPQLPELTSTQSDLLAEASSPVRYQRRASGGSAVRAAGTAGVARRGAPTSLLLTQLALDDDVFEARFAAGELLYRHHPAGSRPRVRPVTIVLDTTPPTFGPAEGVLRLTAHLIIRALWQRGTRPLLVTLTEPRTVREPAQPADLLEVWTSRTLDPPDLAAAWHTAATASSNATVTLTVHHHAPADTGPDRRLVTTHQPVSPPRRPPTGRWQHHLPPEPSPGELNAVLTAVLSSEGELR